MLVWIDKAGCDKTDLRKLDMRKSFLPKIIGPLLLFCISRQLVHVDGEKFSLFGVNNT